jgi:hypothetical protein
MQSFAHAILGLALALDVVMSLAAVRRSYEQLDIEELSSWYPFLPFWSTASLSPSSHNHLSSLSLSSTDHKSFSVQAFLYFLFRFSLKALQWFIRSLLFMFIILSMVRCRAFWFQWHLLRRKELGAKSTVTSSSPLSPFSFKGRRDPCQFFPPEIMQLVFR